MVRDAAREVANGNYEQFLPPTLYEELEDLSASFRGDDCGRRAA